MGKFKFLAGILAMVLVFGMAVVGCDNGSTNGNNNGNGNGNGNGNNGSSSIPSELVGSWGYSAAPPALFVINSDGTGTFGNTGTPQTVTWSATSSKLTLTLSGVSCTFDWSIFSGKLSLTNPTGDLASSLGVVFTNYMNSLGPFEQLSGSGGTGGGNSDPKTLVIQNLPVNMYDYFRIPSRIDLYPVGTALHQTSGHEGLVAWCLLVPPYISVSGSGPYTITIPLSKTSGGNWTGNGTFDVFFEFWGEPDEGNFVSDVLYYKMSSVNISSGTTTVSFGNAMQVY